MKCELIAYIYTFATFTFKNLSIHIGILKVFFRSAALSRDSVLPKPLIYEYFNETVSYGCLEWRP